jgi:LuxR family maltose regulon positive regulatory protein
MTVPGLVVPRRAPSLLPRQRLFAALDAGAPVTVVRAPLGFGKTTLVAQWLAHRSTGELAGRLQITSDCTSGGQFWSAAWHALREAGLSAQSQSADRLPAQQLHAALRAAEASAVLVVDGFERITDNTLERDLRDLLLNCPALRVVVCLRGSRHFTRVNWLALDWLELGPAELALTGDEIHQLLQSQGLAAEPQRVSALQTETGGWPELTTIVVHALAQSGEGDDSSVVATVTADYLRTRLLPQADDEQRDALLASSVVETLSASLLEALLDGRSTKPGVQDLKPAGLIGVPTGPHDVDYRWPPAARRALAEELRRREPGWVADLHRRAALWYLDHDQPQAAMDHAVAAEDWQLAADVIDRRWRWLFHHCQRALAQALSKIPLDILGARPRALAIRDLRFKVPDSLLFSTLPALPDNPAQLADLGASPAAYDVIDLSNILIVSLRHRGLQAESVEFGRKLETVIHSARRSLTPQLAEAAASTAMQIAITRLLADDLAGACRAFQQAYDFTTDINEDYVRRDSAGKMALAYALAGDARQAASWLHRHEAAPLNVSGEWFHYTVSSTAACAQLLIALEHLDLLTAADARELDNPAEPDEFWAHLAYADALYALHAGDAAAGLRILRQHAHPYPSLSTFGPANGPLLAAVEADLLMALGRGNDAHIVLTGQYAAHPSLRVGQARLALLSGHADSAADQTRDLHWARIATPRWQQEMLLIQAIAEHRLGHRSRALNALRRALATATTLDSWRAFTTVPRSELRAIAAELPGEPAWLTRLDPFPDAFPTSVLLIQLTDREQTILTHLTEGLSRTQLAQRLFISGNTVKYHIRGLYRKLGASNREEAIDRARILGLLPRTATPPN